jgi:CRP/FNR family transcriptional regulator, nitrogen oxide reductase regulator
MEGSTQTSDLFKGLSPEQCDQIIEDGIYQALKPKGVLFHQGDPAKYFFMVTSGRLKLSKLNENGKEIIIRYIGGGELTAAITSLQGWDYPVTAEAVEDSEVTAWDKATVLKLIETVPTIAFNLLNIVLHRMDDVQNRYLELCTERVEQRIARSLLRLMRSAGVKTPEGIRIDLPLSRQNIAEFSGTTLFTVSRTLSVWVKNGWISSGREKITIIDPHSLVLFSENG